MYEYLPTHVYEQHVYSSCPWRLEEGIRYPGTGVTDSCEPLCATEIRT